MITTIASATPLIPKVPDPSIATEALRKSFADDTPSLQQEFQGCTSMIELGLRRQESDRITDAAIPPRMVVVLSSIPSRSI